MAEGRGVWSMSGLVTWVVGDKVEILLATTRDDEAEVAHLTVLPVPGLVLSNEFVYRLTLEVERPA